LSKEKKPKEMTALSFGFYISTLLTIKAYKCLSSQTRLLWQAQTSLSSQTCLLWQAQTSARMHLYAG